jgi:hypothetical protein
MESVPSIETQRFDPALSWPFLSGESEVRGLGRHQALLTALGGAPRAAVEVPVTGAEQDCPLGEDADGEGRALSTIRRTARSAIVGGQVLRASRV